MRKNIGGGLLVFALLALVPACSTEQEGQTGKASQKTQIRQSLEASKKTAVAVVNGQVITMYSLSREMNAIAPNYRTRSLSGQARDELIRKDALNILIHQELAVQEARRRGMKISADGVRKELARIRAERGSESAYQTYLDEQGLNEDELKQIIEKDVLFEMIAAHEVDIRVNVSDAALRAYYSGHQAEFVSKEGASRTLSYDEARKQVEQAYRTAEGEKRMREWERELKKGAHIEIVAQMQPNH